MTSKEEEHKDVHSMGQGKEKEPCGNKALINFDIYDVLGSVVQVVEKHDVLIPMVLSIVVSVTTVLLLTR